MVSLNKIKAGTARYLDEEFTAKLTGWQKWVFGAGAAMYLENLTGIMERVRGIEAVRVLNLVDDAGNVDIERMYLHLKAQSQKGSVTFDIPMIGTVTLKEADVDRLYTCIMQS